MTLSWKGIRALNGSQNAGFEELCAQLARAESPNSASFVRKGSPDAGVECYCVLDDGSEWGWQAKYFLNALSSPQWSQLDDSVKSALEKHPALTRYRVNLVHTVLNGPGLATAAGFPVRAGIGAILPVVVH